MYLDKISLFAQFLLLNLKRSEIKFGFGFLCSLIKCLISSNEVLVVQLEQLSSEYIGKILFFIYFGTELSNSKSKEQKKTHPEKTSYIFPKEVLLTFRDGCSSIRKIKKSSILQDDC